MNKFINYTELIIDKTREGYGDSNLKFIPPDPIYIDAFSAGKGTPAVSGPYSDAMITAAIADSIQEWNWRSPRQGGAPFEGRY